MKSFLFISFLVVFVCSCFGQERPGTLLIDVRVEERALAGATVLAEGKSYSTDENGRVVVSAAPGELEISASASEYAPAAVTVMVLAGQEQRVVIELEAHEEEIVVSATRTDARLDDQPTRVEVLDRDEIEEKMLMTPGDIVMMLNEMGGMRVQTTSPSLGAASVRIQGMRGRYTRFLSDGLPLFGQQVGGLGLLQIPPMDLGHVEVIKGTASSLYGAGAMGGVVNLVSRRPGKERKTDFLLNQSTRGATDGVVFLSSPLSDTWGMSLLGGGHYQRRNDVDDDGWVDMAGYKRGMVRPRFFWDGGNGSTLFVTSGVTVEEREGGTLGSAVLPGSGAPYREALQTVQFDVGAVGQTLLGKNYVLSGRFAAGRRTHDHEFGEVRERDDHDTLFAEATLRRTFARHTLVAGAALERDVYIPRDVPWFRFEHVVPGVFVQDDIVFSEWFAVSASARVDHHNEYGTFFSPRLSALVRKGKWSSRLSAGQGFFAPTPLTEETEAAGLGRLVIPTKLKAERGQSASLDITRAAGWASYTVTLFGSRVKDPVDVERTTAYEMMNLPEATTNAGVEFLATFRREPFAVTANYTLVQSRETEGSSRVLSSLTPRHSAGLVAMWEKEKQGRVGLEVYYTGEQRLESNPYRDHSRPYVIVGALLEKRFGGMRAFLNLENLTGVRQTRWDPLLRPTRAPDGRWTVDAWAPLEGRVINGGVRFEF